jgi:hypothetical protein
MVYRCQRGEGVRAAWDGTLGSAREVLRGWLESHDLSQCVVFGYHLGEEQHGANFVDTAVHFAKTMDFILAQGMAAGGGPLYRPRADGGRDDVSAMWLWLAQPGESRIPVIFLELTVR